MPATLRAASAVGGFFLLAAPSLAILSKNSFSFVLSLLILIALATSFITRNAHTRARFFRGVLGALLAASPLLPILSRGALQTILAGVVAIDVFHFGLRKHRWSAPMQIVLAGPLLADLLSFICNYQEYRAVVPHTPLRAILTAALTVMPSWKAVAEFSILMLLIGVFCHHVRDDARALRLSALCGALGAVSITILQRYVPLEGLVVNQTPFWSSISRLAGSFTDPNSQGVYLFEIVAIGAVPLFLAQWRQCSSGQLSSGQLWARRMLLLVALILVTSVISFAGFLSGSRSFILGILLLVALCTLFASRRYFTVVVIVLFIFVTANTAVEWFLGSHVYHERLATFPEGLRRVVLAGSVWRVEETFFSRRVFFDMAWAAIREHSVWGIGPGQFRYFSPALASLVGEDLKGWSDNANNFYLGVVAEYGLIGLLALLWVAWRRCLVRGQGRGDTAALGAILLLLCTGPHVEAPEVCVLTAFVIGVATRVRDDDWLKERDPLVVSPVVGSVAVMLLATIGGANHFSRQRGVYGWEREGGAYHEWIAPVARISRVCGCAGNAEFTIEVPRTSHGEPVQVTIQSPSGEVIQGTFSRSGVKNFTVPCLKNPGAPFAKPELFTISSSLHWVPGAEGGNDVRLFGARVRHRSARDLLTYTPCS